MRDDAFYQTPDDAFVCQVARAASDLVGSSVTIIEPREGSIEFSDSTGLFAGG